jgi:hypothetical protein
MGMVYADIELINAEDLAMARRNLLDQDEIRRIHINILVDNGSYMMAINQNIQSILNLPFKYKKRLQLADAQACEYDVVGPLEVKFGDRTATCNAVVLPGDSEPLLGAIPMEEMGVLINPQRQELIALPEPYLKLMTLIPCKNSSKSIV